MSKYDDQLNRMLFLMEDEKKPTNKVSQNLWYHANGADGKVYGIVKEGAKFYIKTTESGKENIVESYDYINGFVNRRENEFKSYDNATKHLELKLMSLNEAYGKKTDVSTVDFKRNEKALANLTEEARKELDRMNQIIENCDKIGPNNICDPESKGSAKPEQTEKNNDPFDKKVTPDMDYAGSKGTVEESGDGSKVSDVSSDLQSDKMKTKNSNLDDKGNDKEYKKTEDDLEGKSVAAQNPSGGKVVRVNEGIFEMPEIGDEGELDSEMPAFNDELDAEEPVNDLGAGDFEDGFEPAPEDVMDEPVGIDDEEGFNDEELDAMLQEFLNNEDEEPVEESEDVITGPDKVMDKENNPINGTNNGVDDEKGEDWKRVGDKVNIKEDDGYGETDKSEEPETMDNYKFGYNDEKKLPAQSWDKMKDLNESERKIVKRLTDKIYESLLPKKRNTLQEKIEQIVKEEITNLNVWGQHPKYGKEPMTHPEAKEVLAGTADRDFNDDSAKGSERYGKKVGVGKPFDQDVVDLLTDQVLAKLKSEAYK